MSLKFKFVSLKSIAIILYKYFSQEARRGTLFHSTYKPSKRTQHAMGINCKTLLRWLREDGHNFKKPKETRGRRNVVDNFDEEIIKRAIHRILVCKEALTIKTMKTYLKKNNDFHILKTRLWSICKGCRIYISQIYMWQKCHL